MADPIPQSVQIAAGLSPEGGGLPVHASQFQVVVDTSEVTFVFLQKSLNYAASSLTPTLTHRVVSQVSVSHMLAKDMLKQLTKAINDFERQFPIPDAAPMLPPSS